MEENKVKTIDIKKKAENIHQQTETMLEFLSLPLDKTNEYKNKFPSLKLELLSIISSNIPPHKIKKFNELKKTFPILPEIQKKSSYYLKIWRKLESLVFKAFTKQTPIKDLEIFVEIAEYRGFKLDDLKKSLNNMKKNGKIKMKRNIMK